MSFLANHPAHPPAYYNSHKFLDFFLNIFYYFLIFFYFFLIFHLGFRGVTNVFLGKHPITHRLLQVPPPLLVLLLLFPFTFLPVGEG